MVAIDFIKFSISSFIAAFAGSHLVFKYYEPMSVCFFINYYLFCCNFNKEVYNL
jgi:hypothetical protein